MAAPEPAAKFRSAYQVLDAESAEWVRVLGSEGREREAALGRLHEMLLRIARSELVRRGGTLRGSGPELDDLAHQAAGDALVSIIGKLATFRGDSRFTTWAYKFVIFEMGTKLGRHFWRDKSVSLTAESWDRLPDRFGPQPAREAEWHDLMSALRRAVNEELTERQRGIFVAIVLNDVPADALAVRYATNRNAIYKVMFDVRRKLRAALVAGGYLDGGRQECS